MICTHATLRFAFNQLDVSVFNDTLLAIDEFHHVSSGDENKLGEVVNILMKNSSSHIIAMTGSYFRGDNQPVLLPEAPLDIEFLDSVLHQILRQLHKTLADLFPQKSRY